MSNILYTRKKMIFFLIYLIIKNSFEQDTLDFELIIKNKEEPDIIPFTFQLGDDKCIYWIPSLFDPFLIVKYQSVPTGSIPYEKVKDFSFINPLYEENIKVGLYKYSLLNKNIEIILGEDEYIVKKCYFGLSSGLADNGLDDNINTLDYLKNKDKIKQKIFSIDKWNISDVISSKLHFGYEHPNFNIQNKKYIGICKNIEEDKYWGCFFEKMFINNTNIPLIQKKDDTQIVYKVYFSTEDHNIILPQDLENIFAEATKCNYDYKNNLEKCINSFDKNQDYIPLKLINENMTITAEIDRTKRFNKNIKEDIINVSFGNNNFIVLPLILFKNFDIQFDADKNIISFYSDNKDILQVNYEESNKNEEESSSTGLKVFLVILIILIILTLGFVIIYLIRKKRSNIEKNINRFTKFDDEEDFKNMNENKVY